MRAHRAMAGLVLVKPGLAEKPWTVSSQLMCSLGGGTVG
jgi:hypothetical protein